MANATSSDSTTGTQASMMYCLPLLLKEAKNPGPACKPTVKMKSTSPILCSMGGITMPRCPNSSATNITAATSSENPHTLMRPAM